MHLNSTPELTEEEDLDEEENWDTEQDWDDDDWDIQVEARLAGE